VFPARYELNSYIVCRKRLVSKRISRSGLLGRTFHVNLKISPLLNGIVRFRNFAHRSEMKITRIHNVSETVTETDPVSETSTFLVI
jgi:hypothetical protein